MHVKHELKPAGKNLITENLWFPVTCKENLKLTERETRRTKKPMENNDQRQSYIMITKKLKNLVPTGKYDGTGAKWKTQR